MDKGINGPNMNRRREELDKGQVTLIREKKDSRESTEGKGRMGESLRAHLEQMENFCSNIQQIQLNCCNFLSVLQE